MWAAGNGGYYNDSCAADGYVNSIYTIAIGSAGSDGRPAYYDERCSAKLAVTFVHNPFSSYLHVVSSNFVTYAGTYGAYKSMEQLQFHI